MLPPAAEFYLGHRYLSSNVLRSRQSEDELLSWPEAVRLNSEYGNARQTDGIRELVTRTMASGSTYSLNTVHHQPDVFTNRLREPRISFWKRICVF